MKKLIITAILISVFAVCASTTSFAQTTAITYNGNLSESGLPANGSFDFRFALFDDPNGGSQIGSLLEQTNITVTNGNFAATLDFGAAAFPGADRWLQISVRHTGGVVYNTLLPRTQLVSAPYAIRALTVTGPVTGSNAVASLSVSNSRPGINNPDPISNLPPAALLADETSTTNVAAGVIGRTSAENGIGSLGVTNGNMSATGVAGIATSFTGNTKGIQGTVFSSGGVAVFADNIGNGGDLFKGNGNVNRSFRVDSQANVTADGNLNVGGGASVSGTLQVGGNLAVTGTKSALVQLSDGRLIKLYAVESPENWFEDFGTVRLRRGRAWIKLDPTFAKTVNVNIPYKVFLTPDGNCRGLYVARKSATGFEVRELGGGHSNITFDYRVIAKRLNYEKERFGVGSPKSETAR